MTVQPLVSKRKNKKKSTWISLCLSVVGVVVFFSLLLHVLTPYKRTHLFSPLLSFAASVDTVGDTALHVFVSKKSLIEKNALLEKTIQDLEGRVALLDSLTRENDELKKMLGRDSSPTASVLARVIARPLQTPYDVISIDQGTDDGVSVGDLVVANGAYALGRVAEASPHFATVTLFTTPKEETHAFLGVAHLAVTLQGRGGGNFTLELPRDVTIEPNEFIVLENAHTYLLGDTFKELSDPRDPIKTVIVRSPVNFWHLAWVEVISS